MTSENTGPANGSNNQNDAAIVGTGTASVSSKVAADLWIHFRAPILWLLAFVPLLVVHFNNMWYRPQYQYFPFVIGTVGYLIWTRSSPIPDGFTGPVRRYRAYFLLLMSLLIFGIGTALFSPWFVAVGFVLATGSSLLFLRERFEIENAFGIWLITCLLVPLPGMIDMKLSQWLQRLTTIVSGHILEFVSIPNIIEGTTLILASKRLGIEEACSGIVSMMAIVASCLILAVLSNRALLHSILLVASGIAWAAVTNVLRIVTLGFALEKFGIDLSEGWRHDVLGLVLFVGALVLAVSTDRLLCFVLSPIDMDNGLSWPTRTWDALVTFMDPAAPGIVEGRKGKAEMPLSLSSVPMMACAGVFLLLGVASTAHGFLRAGAGESASFSPGTAPLVESLGEDFLPARIGDWKRVGFETTHSERLFAQQSRVWRYQSEDKTAVFSVDFSFPTWHDLCECYSKIGWSQNGSSELNKSSKLGGDFLSTNFYKNTASEGILFFSFVENNGVAYVPPESLTWAGEAKRRLQPDKTLYQIQLWVTENGDLSNYERGNAKDLFVECRRRIVNHVSSGKTTKGID